jgi:alpha-mannosidase
VLASARAHNIPPRVVVARRAQGTGPLARSFLRIDPGAGNLVLSALKQGEESPSVVVRLFNPGDEEAYATLRMDGSVHQAFAVNFLEERHGKLAEESGAIALRLTPHQIQTIEIVRRD